MAKFTPLPEDTIIVHSFDEVEPDEHDPAEDGDDTLVSTEPPTLLARIRNLRKP